MDFLGVLEKQSGFDIKNLKEPGDIYKAYKFEEPVKQVKRAKDS